MIGKLEVGDWLLSLRGQGWALYVRMGCLPTTFFASAFQPPMATNLGPATFFAGAFQPLMAANVGPATFFASAFQPPMATIWDPQHSLQVPFHLTNLG
jgi:hypothetical protein